jgi:hypothetical protein
MWDAFQREVLAALGHEVLVLATANAADADRVRGEPVQAATVQAAGAMPPLQQALLRAVGGDAARLAGLPPLDQLRTPAAKRALWPRLRALRRS